MTDHLGQSSAARDPLRTISEGVDWLEHNLRLACEALVEIEHYDAYQGGPIAPRENPTTTNMRRIAREALERIQGQPASRGRD